MPKLTIDGREVEVAGGTTILQAALTRGRDIPHYCYHPGLSISGNCRMCLVEVEKAPKLLIACDTRVQDGMVVQTDSERVRAARRTMMEFFLINHPLDCPICDQAGECRLQEYAMAHGQGYSRYVDPKNISEKAVDIGRHVMLDQERCIQCSRCIRFCDEVTKTGELAFFRRGEKTVIGVVPGKPLDNPYSGNVVDICPVGALTLKEFRFQTRVWYLENTPSICGGCARGCNVFIGVGQQRELMTTLGQLDERIKRLVPRFNEAVNGHWMCDEGRLSFGGLYSGKRLDRAQAPAGTAVSWDDGISAAASLLKDAAGAGRAAVLLSPRSTSETLHAWSRLAKALGGVKVGSWSMIRGEDDDLLVRADKAANSRGAQWILGESAADDAVLDAAGRGEIDTLFVVGDPLDPSDTVAPEQAVLEKIRNVVYVGPFATGPAERAAVALPAAAWSEEDGTWVNFQGRIQRVRRSHLPHGEGRPGWRVVVDLAVSAGVDLPEWTDVSQVLDSLSGSVAEYDGVNLDGLGLLGAPGRGASAVTS